jgi:hypothetical protein
MVLFGFALTKSRFVDERTLRGERHRTIGDDPADFRLIFLSSENDPS